MHLCSGFCILVHFLFEISGDFRHFCVWRGMWMQVFVKWLGVLGQCVISVCPLWFLCIYIWEVI
jgi:hypothetical protein